MTTNTTKPKATHEVYVAGAPNVYRGACRLCRYATARTDLDRATVRIINHVCEVHGVEPREAR